MEAANFLISSVLALLSSDTVFSPIKEYFIVHWHSLITGQVSRTWIIKWRFLINNKSKRAFPAVGPIFT